MGRRNQPTLQFLFSKSFRILLTSQHHNYDDELYDAPNYWTVRAKGILFYFFLKRKIVLKNNY